MDFRAHGTLFEPSTYQIVRMEMVMKAYLAHIPMPIWVLLSVPALIVSRCVITAVVPVVVHAVVPEVVRAAFRFI